MANKEIAPFSYKVKVGHVSANPVTVTLKANEAERAGLALIWDVEAVKELEAELHIARWKKDGVRLKGEVAATIVQKCVVTLAPVESEIRETVDQVYVPEGSRLARHVFNESGEMVLDPEGDDIPETFSGDAIDAGVAVSEFVALAIDPYPRAPGAEFESHIESDDATDKKPSPFAVLKEWKKD
ncbi:DUF177 domain-containing protein [Rhizobium sp. L1K21]|uniref:YceD family protein n=1 Tax=Rhizobium sp. L1K21 TaxID=2954933 RepID=UPI00209301A3|nr:DUF177 domain-containing protein [Rhizobium sp. L1K21]MCO6185832.1 DUF177 domain-containing protein [Rhizobium sp. L1K21]